MNLSFHDWYDGYVMGTTAIKSMLKNQGWARAKGDVKAHISCNVTIPSVTRFGQGFTDAYLDSVGC